MTVSPAFVLLLLILAPFILLSLWSIWHALFHRFPSLEEQALWIFLAAIVPVIGGLLYFAVGRHKVVSKRTWSASP